jgi:protein CpxP
MNYFDKNKILTIAVVLLLFTNIGILSLLWFDRVPGKHFDRIPPPNEMHPPFDRKQSEGGPRDFLIRELGFTEKQKQDYQLLIDEHKSDMKKLMDKIRTAKEKLWDNLSETDTASISTESTSAEIGNDQKEIELVTFRHFQKVKELCDENQKKKFDEVIKEVINMMGHNKPPPPNKN